MSQYIYIGKVAATFGVKGELIITHQLGKEAEWKKITAFFIEKNRGSHIPYFLKSIVPKSDTEALIQLENIYSKETARTFLKKNIYLEASSLSQIVNRASNLFYIGFTLLDSKEKELGTVSEVIELPNQLLARVFQNENELLIPLTPQTIRQIDEDRRILYLALPDGLLDVYKDNNPQG